MAVLPQVEGELTEALTTAEAAYQQAEDAYYAARRNHSAVVGTLAYASLMRRGQVRSQDDSPKYMPSRDDDRIKHARLWLSAYGVGATEDSVELTRVFDRGIPRMVPKPRA